MTTSTDVVPESTFPNYLEIPRRVPVAAWRAIQMVSVAVAVAIIVTLFVAPDMGLTIFWKLLVPLLPLVFLTAPGVWRNVCPLAALNQTPRRAGFTREFTAPIWLREYGYVVAMFLFVGLVFTRKALFNHSGPATGVLLAIVLGGAFVGGVVLKGKSGWCSSICPLLPVQRVYGQSPLVTSPNSHCDPCLGCTKNCYDFNPKVAYVADMHDHDRHFAGYRRLFVAAFPGIVLGYFLVPDPPVIGRFEMYGRASLWVLASVAVFTLLDTFAKLRPALLPQMFGAAAACLFYWFGAQKYATTLTDELGRSFSFVVWPVRVAVLGLAVAWLARGRRAEVRFEDEAGEEAAVRVELGAARGLRAAATEDRVAITFEPGERVVAVRSGATLLDAAESSNLRLEAGCRMGVCGADPVAVLEGAESLSPVTRAEADTLERLGLGGSNRMACCARVLGECRVALAPDRTAAAPRHEARFVPDQGLGHVVIIGNGIGGVTTADFVRRNHPDCTIEIIGREPHNLYNRMGISRLIFGRSAMQGLYLLPDDWYEQNNVSCWLNTTVAAVDRAERDVVLGTGQRLRYDALVIAVGSRSTNPPIENFDLPGCFVLREAADAIQLRTTVQAHGASGALVAGGGLLGLEAAHAMHQLGLDVVVAERAERLLRHQIDAAASRLLRDYFEDLGIRILTNIETKKVEGADRAERAIMSDGTVIDCDIVVGAIGITPNIELARSSGLQCGRGVIVDARMRTSDPAIYAIGDVAEYNGRIWGLWPVAVEQAQIAAVNIAGGDATYEDVTPVTILKGAGLDALSFGHTDASADDDIVIVDERPGHVYRKIIVAGGRIVGGVFLGAADESALAQMAYEAQIDVSVALDAVRGGDWNSIEGALTAQPASVSR